MAKAMPSGLQQDALGRVSGNGGALQQLAATCVHCVHRIAARSDSTKLTPFAMLKITPVCLLGAEHLSDSSQATEMNVPHRCLNLLDL